MRVEWMVETKKEKVSLGVDRKLRVVTAVGEKSGRAQPRVENGK